MPRHVEWVHTSARAMSGLRDERDVHAWLLPLDAPWLQHERLVEALGDDERARADRHARPEDRRRFATAHALLRHLLARYTGQPPASLVYVAGRHGKPSPAGQPGVRRPAFSLSRSGPYALVAVTATADIGVDVEIVDTLADHEAIARDYFTAEERAELGRLAAHRRCDGFLAGWTRKEAILKALGSGFQTEPDRLVISMDPDAPVALRALDGRRDAGSAWSLWSSPLDAGGWTAVAVHRHDARLLRMILGPTPVNDELSNA